MAKPTEKTEWAEHADALVLPTDSNRWDYGWSTPANDPTGIGEKPNLNQQNYWQNAVHKWKEYFETTTDTNTSNIATNASDIDALESAKNDRETSTSLSLVGITPVSSVSSVNAGQGYTTSLTVNLNVGKYVVWS